MVTKPDNQNLTRSRSLGTKPKPKPVSSSEPEAKDGSDRKTIEKPLPNYLKPTISSKPNLVKLTRKNNAVEDKPKLLRRQSFDRPSSSLTSKSTSSSSHTSLARPRDKPVVPKEKPLTGLRSTSFHGTKRGYPGAKTSALSSSSSSKSKKEASENVPKKSSGEITPDSSPLAPAHRDGEEILKVETDVQVSDHREEQKEEDKDQVARPDESEEETKKEVVQGKKESRTAYNDVIASKMQENLKKKNKVLALAGAFQTVIDYETAASK